MLNTYCIITEYICAKVDLMKKNNNNYLCYYSGEKKKKNSPKSSPK